MIVKNLCPFEINIRDQHDNCVLSLPAGPEDAVVPAPEEGVIYVVDPVAYYVKYEMRGDLTTPGRLLGAQVLFERASAENLTGSKTLLDFLGETE